MINPDIKDLDDLPDEERDKLASLHIHITVSNSNNPESVKTAERIVRLLTHPDFNQHLNHLVFSEIYKALDAKECGDA